LPSITLGAAATRYNEPTLMRAKVSENFTPARDEGGRNASKPLMDNDSPKTGTGFASPREKPVGGI
jgi:hypothetical protein